MYPPLTPFHLRTFTMLGIMMVLSTRCQDMTRLMAW
jgi:hypothetical protein